MKKVATKSKKTKAPVQKEVFDQQLLSESPIIQQQQPPMMQQQQQPPMMQMPQVNYGNSVTPNIVPVRRQQNVRGGVYGMKKA